MLYDAFICHASEDKDDFVRPLADALANHHLEIWYDEFSLSVGDGLRRAIDAGLAKSRFGIVVLSPHFLKKGWAQRELDGLVARQIAEDRRLILPIWHNVTATDIVRYSPPLADTVALLSSRGISNVCADLVKKLRPDESPLIAARDELLRWGIEPPVISDEWWLNIVEASNRMSNGGAVVPDTSVWGTWTFPLPHENSFGSERGRHLAWTALQIEWSEYAEKHKICQISHPDEVHKYITDFPGLAELCIENPRHVACYAPQLTIHQFSGFLGQAFDDEMNLSIGNYKQRSITKGLCDEQWCLRHPQFGGHKPSEIAHNFFSGQMFAPKVEGFELFEYVVWLLSDHSNWLPDSVREMLIRGTIDWPAWTNSRNVSDTYDEKGFFHALLHRTQRNFKFTKRVRDSLDRLIDDALRKLGLPSDVRMISDAFINAGYVEGYYENDIKRRARR
jgi:hypothetical protein